jgi:hypothetical protein
MNFKATEIASITVAGLSLIGAIISAFYSYSNRNRELDIRLVEIGIGILRADPKETGISPAREWALRVIEENSGLQFSEDDRRALLNKPLLYHPSSGAEGIDPKILQLIEAMQKTTADQMKMNELQKQSRELMKTLADQMAKEQNKRGR